MDVPHLSLLHGNWLSAGISSFPSLFYPWQTRGQGRAFKVAGPVASDQHLRFFGINDDYHVYILSVTCICAKTNTRLCVYNIYMDIYIYTVHMCFFWVSRYIVYMISLQAIS